MLQQLSSHTGKLVVLLLCVCFLVLAFVIVKPSHEHRPRRVRLQRRYPTERQIFSPVYHEHKLPSVPIDLKARYDERRELVKHGRRRLQARSAALDRFRRDSQSDTLTDARDFIPLMAPDDRQFDLTCGSCSLVSNSGYIRKSSMGRDIDRADCVFRMDAAPTNLYQRDVGRRTTVRVVSYTSISELASKAETILALKPSASHLIFHGPYHVLESSAFRQYLDKLREAQPDVLMYRTGPGLEDKADFELLLQTGQSRHSSSAEFSTDMYAMFTMKRVCSSIKVYGMLPRDFCSENPRNRIPFSYYKNPGLTACSVYDYHDNLEVGGQLLSEEKQVFDGWRAEINLKFRHPEWE